MTILFYFIVASSTDRVGSSSPSGRFVRFEMEGGSFEPSASELENMDVRFRMEGGNFEPSASDRASMRPWIQSFASS
ncbi:hypothetical protein DY000_02028409 [Brassica cretica]|uniref:Uncharacterized protein n=1 Tax=Brassica cretica TaxID=69181 RepID=A0ABQ7DRW1_BRACR|nr:hypothetical protein DY000_02028409 [Brassica cretica]